MVFQCLTGGQGNLTHTCCLLTLAHGAGTVLQHITISIWHCLLCLMPTHTNTTAHNSWPYKPTTGTMGIVYWLLAKLMPGLSPRQSRAQRCEGKKPLNFSFKRCHQSILIRKNWKWGNQSSSGTLNIFKPSHCRVPKEASMSTVIIFYWNLPVSL